MFPLVSGRHVGAHLEGHQHDLQPRSQGLFTLPPLVVGRKTLVAADHVTTQNLGGKKNLLDRRDGRVFCLLMWQTLWVSNHDHLAVAKNYSFYRGSKPNLPMKDVARFLTFLKYRRLPFTKKFGSRTEQKQVPNRSETSSGSVF